MAMKSRVGVVGVDRCTASGEVQALDCSVRTRWRLRKSDGSSDGIGVRAYNRDLYVRQERTVNMSYDKRLSYSWQSLAQTSGEQYQCSYCGNRVGPSNKFLGTGGGAGLPAKNVSIFICPVCNQPTFFDYFKKQIPGIRLGADLQQVPTDGLKQLYDEARDCSAASAFTACVMACRKILMNLAVREGAKEGLGFVEYVDYLNDNGYVPKKGKDWVDRIRKMGNEANHAIASKNQSDASDILHLVEMLLRFNFELSAPTP